MKRSRDQSNRQSKQGWNKVPKPEIRDDLDSREGEEFQTRKELEQKRVKKSDKSHKPGRQ